MILHLVSELLARVARRPVVEEALETLRRTGGEVRLAPGGRHLMLMRPSHDLGKSAAIDIEFHFDACAAPVSAVLPIRRDQDK